MGIQGTNIGDVTDVTGASILIVEQACENSQLLVSLCRNGNQWLSPVGWTEKQKITLLDCRSQGGNTEIDIPAEFSKILMSGDTLLLKCSELDLEQKIIWEASNIQTRPLQTRSAADFTQASTRLSGGLLSRFKSSPKAAENTDTKSEAQLRADEADVAAKSYRAKMEAATAAKEDAQRRALEASREAEAALKMEAERIADMERAAKAFEEAERLKQDGLRRVEEERRQEKLRIAEAARRVEEESKRAEAAKVEVERKAALERLESALDADKNENMRLQNRLSKLKVDGETLKVQQLETSTVLSTLNDDIDTVQNRVKITGSTFKKKVSELDELNIELAKLRSKSDSGSSETTAISDRVAQVEAEYLTAQRDAEMAIAHAEEKRRLLDAAREDKTAVLSQQKTLARTLETQASLLSEMTLTTHNLQSKFDAAQAELDDKTTKIASLETDKLKILDTLQTNRVEIEATQQAVEDCLIRQTAHQKAVAHLETGGDLETIPELDLGTRFFKKEIDNDVSFFNTDETLSSEVKTSGLLGRVRRSFLRSKETEISIEVNDVRLSDEPHDIDEINEVSLETPAKPDAVSEVLAHQLTDEDILTEPDLKTVGFVRRHSKSLLALGTILGGAAIFGGGFIGTKTDHLNNSSVKSSYPAATKYATTAQEVSLPALTPPVSTQALAAPVIKKDLPGVETLPEVQLEVVSLDIPDVPVIPIPNLTMTGLSLENLPGENIPAAKVAVIKKAAIKKAAIKKPVKPKITKIQKPKNYPELTTRVQRQLQTLGFYTGPLNGRKTQQTTEAIRTFQELYALPQHGRMSGKFLSELSNAEVQHSSTSDTQLVNVQAANTQVRNIQLAETSFSSPSFNNTLAFTPTIKVVMDSLPASSSYVSSSSSGDFTEKATVPVGTGLIIESALSAAEQKVTEQKATEPKSNVVKQASAPRVKTPTQAPTVQDVVVAAKRIKAAKVSYPRSAAVKNYFADVRIVVGYDIDPFGKVVNARVLTNDHTGRFNTSFERAAVKAVKQQRFTAKTVNGYPVGSTGKTQRIVFKG